MAWGGKKVAMGLSGWNLLGAVLAAFVGFGVYAYAALDTRSAYQAGGGKYVVPELEAAQPNQQSGGPSRSTRSSSSGTDAPNPILPAEDAPPILTDSGATDPSTGSAVPTETPLLGDTIVFSKASAQPLPVQAAGISTPDDSCTSRDWCANPPQQTPNLDNVTPRDASSCTDDKGEDSCNKEKTSKEKNKKKTNEKPFSHRHSQDKS
jgi:hypothetical protein